METQAPLAFPHLLTSFFFLSLPLLLNFASLYFLSPLFASSSYYFYLYPGWFFNPRLDTACVCSFCFGSISCGVVGLNWFCLFLCLTWFRVVAVTLLSLFSSVVMNAELLTKKEPKWARGGNYQLIFTPTGNMERQRNRSLTKNIQYNKHWRVKVLGNHSKV